MQTQTNFKLGSLWCVRSLRVFGALFGSIVCSSCGGSGGANNATTSSTVITPVASCSVTQMEAEMNNQLAQLSTDTDFSFAVERDDGRRYVYQRGSSRMQTLYESASTSKLVSAVIILRLVEQGYLKLEDKPQDRQHLADSSRITLSGDESGESAQLHFWPH
jgi:hypothetical protein